MTKSPWVKKVENMKKEVLWVLSLEFTHELGRSCSRLRVNVYFCESKIAFQFAVASMTTFSTGMTTFFIAFKAF